MKKSIILVRAKEQKLIDKQLNRVCGFCKTHCFDIVRTVTIDDDGAKGVSKKFARMIRYLKRRKTPITLVVDSIGVLQQDTDGMFALDDLCTLGKIEIRCVCEDLLFHRDSIKADMMAWYAAILTAGRYASALNNSVKESMRHSEA
jgi:DNA invertase Pin-like site-specific DNA recombinase